MTGLADFLRARLLEFRAEEAPHSPDCDSVPAAQSCCGNKDCDCGDRTYPCDCSWPALIAADIDSKLAIVDAYASAEKALNAWACADDSNIGHAGGLEEAVRLLGQPFAGHPDYQEEWRP